MNPTPELEAMAKAMRAVMHRNVLDDHMFELFAKAALLALQEPTEGMEEALSSTNKMWRELDSKTVWQTYINYILGADQ